MKDDSHSHQSSHTVAAHKLLSNPGSSPSPTTIRIMHDSNSSLLPVHKLPINKWMYYYQRDSKQLKFEWAQTEPVEIGTRYLSLVGVNIIVTVTSLVFDSVSSLYIITVESS